MFTKKPIVRIVRTAEDVYNEQLQNWYFKMYAIGFVWFFLIVSLFVKAFWGEAELPTIQESFNIPNCRITQGSKEHQHKDNWSIYAIDMACEVWEAFKVKVPNTFRQFTVDFVWKDKILWDYIVIKNENTRYVFWHTKAIDSIVEGKKVESGDILGVTNMSWVTKGIHVHTEKWIWEQNVSMTGPEVNEFSEKVCNQRNWSFCRKHKNKFYFTHYDLGDTKQNDSDACKWATGVDLCFLSKNGMPTIAVTADIRKEFGINFRDKVYLEGDEGCQGIYEVHDEMNIRFRESCIKRPGTDFCIKGDIPGKKGGACTISKIKY